MHLTALTVLTAAGAVLASPVQTAPETLTVPLKHRVNAASAAGLVERGHARINKINGAKTVGNIDASGPARNEDVSYIASVTIGTKAWDLIVDTGCKLWRGT